MTIGGKQRLVAAMVALGLVAACSKVGLPSEDIVFDNVVLETNRSFAAAYLQQPFELGPISVIATENARLRTYRLVPCREGWAICAGGPSGQAGQLQVTPDHSMVTALYGRTFFLSPGGDGTLRRGSQDVALAWNADLRPGPQPLYPVVTNQD